MKHRLMKLWALTLVAVMAFSGVALADTLASDGDHLASGNNVTVDTAAECDGHTFTGRAVLSFQGSNHFDNGSSVTVSSVLTEAGRTAGITVGASETRTLSNWNSTDRSETFNTSVTVPDGIANGTYQVDVKAVGSQTKGGTVNTQTITNPYSVTVNCATPDPVVVDTDADDDGIQDESDNCVNVANLNQADADGDGQGDACDGDRDGDGVANGSDNCADARNADQANLDGDGEGDACDGDRDGDGVANGSDNCADAANANQANLDGDGLGDVCDPDIDGDNVANGSDNCPLVSNALQEDNDGDGFGRACDSNDFAPVLGSTAQNADGIEGSTLGSDGSFTDGDGNNSLTLTADNTEGAFRDNGDGTWSWSLATTDDVAGGTITVTAYDDEHTRVTDSFSYSASNANPVITNVSQTRNGACAVTLGATYTDAGSADTHTTSARWADGATGLSRTFTAAGSYTATVTVTDDDGGAGSMNTAVQTLNTPSAILQPINSSGSRSGFKIGSTIPVKITVTDCGGQVVSTLTPAVNLQKGDATPDAPINETVQTDSATNGKLMRWDATSAQYIYNLSTKLSQFTGAQLTPGTYTVSVHDASFVAPVKATFDLRK